MSTHRWFNVLIRRRVNTNDTFLQLFLTLLQSDRYGSRLTPYSFPVSQFPHRISIVALLASRFPWLVTRFDSLVSLSRSAHSLAVKNDGPQSFASEHR